MSISTTHPSPGLTKQLPPGRYRLPDVMRSEWTKLRTVRSTMWTLGITILVGIGVSAIACATARAHWPTMTPADRANFGPTRLSLTGTYFGQLVIGVLGILVMSAEYGTGTIRATFSAVPRRLSVLTAKVIVFGLVSLVIAEVLAFLSYFLGQALLTAPAAHTTLASPGALQAVMGTGLFLCVIGLFALALATIIRHTAGAISAFVFILLVLQTIIHALPQSLSYAIGRYLPSTIGQSMLLATGGPHVFAPWNGFIVLCIYVVVLLLIGGVLLVRRDA